MAYKYGKKFLTLLFGLVMVLALYLRIDALREQQLSFPNGTDGSLEFQVYAEKLIDDTFDGEIFPPGTVTHKPFFSILLAGVFEIFGRSAFVLSEPKISLIFITMSFVLLGST